jgi:hypothetical protein
MNKKSAPYWGAFFIKCWSVGVLSVEVKSKLIQQCSVAVDRGLSTVDHLQLSGVNRRLWTND